MQVVPNAIRNNGVHGVGWGGVGRDNIKCGGRGSTQQWARAERAPAAILKADQRLCATLGPGGEENLRHCRQLKLRRRQGGRIEEAGKRRRTRQIKSRPAHRRSEITT